MPFCRFFFEKSVPGSSTKIDDGNKTKPGTLILTSLPAYLTYRIDRPFKKVKGKTQGDQGPLPKNRGMFFPSQIAVRAGPET